MELNGHTADLVGKNKCYWAKRAPSYSTVNREELDGPQKDRWLAALQRALEQAFPHAHPGDLSVLDVGTGPGFFAIALAEAGFQVTAVDYTPSMLREAIRNAGTLASRIRFECMDAENLALPSACFDAVVSRNLTWNLPHPQLAYAEWTRVLKPGGVLVNFDANWYRHLFDKQARRAYETDRARTQHAGVRDEYVGTDIDAMEDIARRVPLGAVERPAWDTRVLAELGMVEIAADEHAWQSVWSQDERVNFASTPLFSVTARRG